MRRSLILVPILLVACSDSGSTTSSDSSGSGTSTSSGIGGSSSEASSSSGLATSTSTGTGSSSSSSSGTGGMPPVAGAPGSETVNGGNTCASPNYKMIMTIGQPTQNQGVTTSPNYRVHGGLVGATN